MTNYYDKLLIDVLIQACGIDGDKIDNHCLSCYQDACDYLQIKGYLERINDRIFKIIPNKCRNCNYLADGCIPDCVADGVCPDDV